jgi:hypothetical protein
MQARSQDLLATGAMPIFSSHADGEANNCVKKLSFDHPGNPAVLWATRAVPGFAHALLRACSDVRFVC